MMDSGSEEQLIFASLAFVAVVAERSRSQEWIGSDWIDLQVWQVMSTAKQPNRWVALSGIEWWLRQPVLAGNSVEASEVGRPVCSSTASPYLSYQLRRLGEQTSLAIRFQPRVLSFDN